MVQCEYTRCGKTLEVSDFKSQDVYPCCGMQVQQKIDFPVLDEVAENTELLEVPEPAEEVVEEKVVEENPAKKAAAKKKPAKKAKK